MYVRGPPSPLVRRLGNPHITARPLRQALYALQGLSPDTTVRETHPVWDQGAQAAVFDEQVGWVCDVHCVRARVGG